MSHIESSICIRRHESGRERKEWRAVAPGRLAEQPEGGLPPFIYRWSSLPSCARRSYARIGGRHESGRKLGSGETRPVFPDNDHSSPKRILPRLVVK